MAPEDTTAVVKDAKKTAFSYLSAWGKAPVPPTLLATLISSLHLRPLQPLPLIFPPILLFSSYLNLGGLVVDSAGITTAFSALYFLLARRRRVRFVHRFSARGLVRGAAMGVAAVNVVACGTTYAFGKREEEHTAL